MPTIETEQVINQAQVSQDQNIESKEAATVISEDPIVFESAEEVSQPKERKARTTLAEKIQLEPENPKIFWKAFNKLQTQIQKEISDSAATTEERDVTNIPDLKQEILKSVSAIQEIEKITMEQDPLIFGELTRFLSLTELPVSEFAERISSFFEAREKGEYPATKKPKTAQPVASLGTIKAAISRLTPEELVSLDEEIRARRAMAI